MGPVPVIAGGFMRDRTPSHQSTVRTLSVNEAEFDWAAIARRIGMLAVPLS